MRKIARLFREMIRYLKFRYYRSIAITTWKVTGKRQWVIPIFGTTKMAVMNNDQIRAYNKIAKKRHWKTMDIKTLMESALYGTPAGSTGERVRK